MQMGLVIILCFFLETGGDLRITADRSPMQKVFPFNEHREEATLQRMVGRVVYLRTCIRIS